MISNFLLVLGLYMLKKFLSIILLICICFVPANLLEQATCHVDGVRVYFSPRGGAEQAIVNNLDAAKEEVLLMAYSFTAKPIADALIRAHNRGIYIIVLLDKSQLKARASKMKELVRNGLMVHVDRAHAIAHNKVIVIDKKYIITGSYNFSKAAEERNAENLLILQSNELAQKYLQNFELHLQHAERVLNYDN